jgi:hypothetical protein
MRDGRDIRAALDAKRPLIVDIDHRGLTSAGELRHPVIISRVLAFRGCCAKIAREEAQRQDLHPSRA